MVWHSGEISAGKGIFLEIGIMRNERGFRADGSLFEFARHGRALTGAIPVRALSESVFQSTGSKVRRGRLIDTNAGICQQGAQMLLRRKPICFGRRNDLFWAAYRNC